MTWHPLSTCPSDAREIWVFWPNRHVTGQAAVMRALAQGDYWRGIDGIPVPLAWMPCEAVPAAPDEATLRQLEDAS